jgi:hypothetical protein
MRFAFVGFYCAIIGMSFALEEHCLRAGLMLSIIALVLQGVGGVLGYALWHMAPSEASACITQVIFEMITSLRIFQALIRMRFGRA